MFFGRGLWGTAIDVSSIGETRRGCEGESGDVNLGFDVGYIRDRGLKTAFEGVCELLCGEGGPSDSRESVSTHASMSLSDTALGLQLDPLSNRGTCVMNETGSGRTGGG